MYSLSRPAGQTTTPVAPLYVLLQMSALPRRRDYGVDRAVPFRRSKQPSKQHPAQGQKADGRQQGQYGL